ncbi:major tail protein [Lysinibacillus sp. NPDC096418]|uniref:major tail protein n=1 Tax=Lysinibacillus sp. NPDC096418 TaxID=3364138 RepID=UPI00380755DC
MKSNEMKMLMPLDIQMFANRVQYGLNNVHYAVLTRAADGSITYGKPVRIPGAVSITTSPTGGANNFYADNGIYYARNANTGYEGTLSIALIPEQFKIDVLGERIVNGMLAEFSDAKSNDIALLYEIEGDEEQDRLAYYDVTVARPNNNANTTGDTIEISPNELAITVKPRTSDKAIKAISNKTLDPDVFANFFTSVQEPVPTPTP